MAAVDYFSRNMALLTGELLRERFGMTGLPAVISRTWLASCLADLGEFDEGIARGNEAIQMAEAAEHPFSLTQAYYALGTLFLRRGDLPKAILVLERGLALCQRADIATWFPTVAAALGYAYTLSGRIPEALPLLLQAVAQDPSQGISAGHARRVAYLSEAYLLAGRRDEAADLSMGMTFWLPRAQATLAQAGYSSLPTRCDKTASPAISNGQAAIDIEVRRRFKEPAAIRVNADVAVVGFVKQVLDAKKRGYEPVPDGMVVAEAQIGNRVAVVFLSRPLAKVIWGASNPSCRDSPASSSANRTASVCFSISLLGF